MRTQNGRQPSLFHKPIASYVGRGARECGRGRCSSKGVFFWIGLRNERQPLKQGCEGKTRTRKPAVPVSGGFGTRSKLQTVPGPNSVQSRIFLGFRGLCHWIRPDIPKNSEIPPPPEAFRGSPTCGRWEWSDSVERRGTQSGPPTPARVLPLPGQVRVDVSAGAWRHSGGVPALRAGVEAGAQREVRRWHHERH